MDSLRRITAAVRIVLIAAIATQTPSHAQSRPLAPGAPRSGPERRTVSVLLNSGFSGANAWLLLAEARGYFYSEGLELQLTTGRGAYTAPSRMVHEGFDFGYGDINALAEEASLRPDSTPVGVFMLFNRSPAAIIVKRSSPITTAKQLEGKRIIGHATDVALNTFDAYAERMRIDVKRVTIVPDSGGWAALLAALDSGRADAIFGYITTATAAVEAAGRDADSTLRFLRYRDAVPELYGSALMASRALANSDPAIVRAFVRAANRGLIAAINDPDAAISEVMRRDSTLRPEIERNRLLRTLHGDMGGEEGASLGIGDIDPKRLIAALRLMRAGDRMLRLPPWETVFSREFLPPLSARVRTLAEAKKK